MSDEVDRAAKAARAKALLKKRQQQQQKVSGNITDGGNTSRTSSPAPAPSTPPPQSAISPQGAVELRDASTLFSQSSLHKDVDFEEYSVLAAPSPLRPIMSPVALGRAISSPPPRHQQNSPHPSSPSRQDQRRVSTPLTGPQANVLNDVELHTQAIRRKYEAEIEQLKADLNATRSAAIEEATKLRSEVSNASEKAKIASQASETKINELESFLSQIKNELEKSHGLLTTQQQTITLLVNEKTALMDQVAELGPLRSRLSETEEYLQGERSKVDGLQDQLLKLEMEKNGATAEIKELKERIQASEGNERSMHEQLRALEVDLENNRRSLTEIQLKLADRENELRIMKEDDMVETLQQELSVSRERVEELGESLSRLQENLATVTQNRDDLYTQLITLTNEKDEHYQSKNKLEVDLAVLKGDLERLHQKHQSISEERSSLQTQLDTVRNSLAASQQQVSALSTDLVSKTRHYDESESSLSATLRKLADTEASLRSLRSENSNLLTQLEEIRHKLVDLMNKTAEDERRMASGDRKIHDLEKEVEVLETDLHNLRLQTDARAQEQEQTVIRLQAEKEELEHEIGESKKAQGELERSMKKLDDELAKKKDEKQLVERIRAQLTQERDILRAEIDSLKIDLDHARYASEELQKSEADSNEVLEGIRAEVESLREQLFEKEQEVLNLRTSTVSKSRPGHGSSQSLSDELLTTFRDQHTLDLSNTHSKIRELESDLFDAKANEHTLQMRITTLEDELSQLQRQFRVDGRRSTSTRPHTPSSLSQSFTNSHGIRPRAVYEENLSTDIRRKRKISLGMLKTRIESERAAARSMSGIGLGMATGSPLSRVSSIVELDETAESEAGADPPSSRPGSRSGSVSSKPNAMVKSIPRLHLRGWDESHIFWCHACKGDLVVL
ncbi:hypothetical protein Clacol_009555 [Clathrus columnatus]|uniref:Uncharacterized protein n=1 Tax=Clathrus columnatus TaxID=1419009 RepID=A0AAV5ARB7_9AGAM|nr:hypothetical protein Clacol_009555 [Clathrus columnatus]